MHVLTINAGSSSLKAGVYADNAEQRTLGVQIERIGLPGSCLRIVGDCGETILENREDLADHQTAARAFLNWLADERATVTPAAIGHRIVHGGGGHREPRLATADVLASLEQFVPLDPEHLPQALAVLRVTTDRFPTIPQVLCFDTAFHRSMPRIAQVYPLPRRLADAGVIRYGFHGLSCEYILHALEQIDMAEARGRIIIAHLGNGASLTAVCNGVGIDTTMGFTPTGGLMMGTRSGDLDPGVVLELLRTHGSDAAAVNHLVNHEAGLLGVSEISADLRDLLEREGTDPRAAEAVELFCYLARKSIGALAAALGGLDTLVFTAGIGERAAPIRQRICAALTFLGLDLDPERNSRHAPIISREGTRPLVRIMKTDEDLIIARHVRRLLSAV